VDIGEIATTQGAFNMMPILAQALPELGDIKSVSSYQGLVKDRSALPSADKVQMLLTENVWAGLLDLWHRPYF
jgi:hypothetical protein